MKGFTKISITFVFLAAAIIFLLKGYRATNSQVIWSNYLIGILFVFFAFLNRFKHFKLFGFAEAEMWEEKQEEAVKLIDQLRKTAFLVTKATASLFGTANRMFNKEMHDQLMRERVTLIEELHLLLKDLEFDDSEILKATQAFSRSLGWDIRNNLLNHLNKIYAEKAKVIQTRRDGIFEKNKPIPCGDKEKYPEYVDLSDQLSRMGRDKKLAEYELKSFWGENIKSPQEIYAFIGEFFKKSEFLDERDKINFLEASKFI